jgi:hypothetical protein
MIYLNVVSALDSVREQQSTVRTPASLPLEQRCDLSRCNGREPCSLPLSFFIHPMIPASRFPGWKGSSAYRAPAALRAAIAEYPTPVFSAASTKDYLKTANRC